MAKKENERENIAFRVITDLLLSSEPNEEGFNSEPRHEGVSLLLNMTENLNKDSYIDKETDQPNTTGRKTMQKVLVQGLMGVIKMRAEEEKLDVEGMVYEVMSDLKKWSDREASIQPRKMAQSKRESLCTCLSDIVHNASCPIHGAGV